MYIVNTIPGHYGDEKSLHGWNNLVYCDLPAVFEGEMTPHRLMSLNTQIPAGDCVSQGCGILRSNIAEGR